MNGNNSTGSGQRSFGDVERLFSAMTNNSSFNSNSNIHKSSSTSSSSLDTNPRPSSMMTTTTIATAKDNTARNTSVSISYDRRDSDYGNTKYRRDYDYERRRHDDYYYERRNERRSEFDERGSDRKEMRRDHKRDYETPNRSRSPEFRRRSRSPRRYSDTTRRQSSLGFADQPKTPPLPHPIPTISSQPAVQVSLEDERVQRDRRTVLVSQIAAKVQSFDLEKFFKDNNCKVRQVRLVMDKSHLRHKGVAYVEFTEESFVRPAIALTGSKLMGIPLVVQLTETEKNRLAQLQNNNSNSGSDLLKRSRTLMADPGLTCIQLDFVHPSVEEETLRQLLRPFGHLEQIKVVRDMDGRSRGTAFCKFKDSLDAKEAVTRLQDYLLVGQRLKLALVKDSIARFKDNAPLGVDEEVNLTAQARTELMLKWARSKNILPQSSANTSSSSLIIRNLPPRNEQEQGYSLESDLMAELERYGSVQNLTVNHNEAIVKFDCMEAAERALNALNGRFFAYRQLEVVWLNE